MNLLKYSFKVNFDGSQNECCICLETFDNSRHLPKILPCFPLHVICGNCLTQLCNINPVCNPQECFQFSPDCISASKIHLRCPFDNLVFHLPDDGIAALATCDCLQTLSHTVITTRTIIRNEINLKLTALQQKCDEVIKECDVLILEINNHNRHCTISRLIGSCTGIVGSVLFVVGAALTPITFGTSSALMIAGSVIGTAGGATTGGGSVVELVLNNQVKTKIQALLLACRDEQLAIQQHCQQLADYDEAVGVLSQCLTEVANKSVAVNPSSAELGCLSSFSIITGIGMAAGQSAMKILGVAVSLIILPVDIVNIVTNSIDIHKAQPTEFVRTIQTNISKMQDDIKCFINDVIVMLDVADKSFDNSELARVYMPKDFSTINS